MTRSEEKEAELSPEEYAKMHQKSFRTAFDFLSSHFPPGQDDEWWIQAAKDLSDASVRAGENKLVTGLLIGVYDYLTYEYERRRNKDGGTEPEV